MVIKRRSVERNSASLPGYEFGSGRIGEGNSGISNYSRELRELPVEGDWQERN
jgi:hypothetical protein